MWRNITYNTTQHNMKYTSVRCATLLLVVLSEYLTQWINHKELTTFTVVEASWNVMVHAQKPDFFFQRKGRVYLNPTTSAGERPTVRIPPGAWIFVCCECHVLSGRGLCDELITRPEEYYRLYCVVMCDLETSRIGAPYIYIYMTLVA
jgi:hypothetical protein